MRCDGELDSVRIQGIVNDYLERDYKWSARRCSWFSNQRPVKITHFKFIEQLSQDSSPTPYIERGGVGSNYLKVNFGEEEPNRRVDYILKIYGFGRPRTAV